MSLNIRTRCIPALAFGLLLGACTGVPTRPMATQALSECGWLPHCVNSQSGRGAQAIEPIKADTEQWQKLKAWIVRQPDWKVAVDDGDFIQAVVTTPALRFRDDVQLLFLSDSRSIHVYSSSRLGISDWGTNARRVEKLRAQVTGTN
jgi:uncharacterized protein (DUF1499 family)